MTADLTAAWFDRVLHGRSLGHVLDLGCGSVPLYEAYGSQSHDVTCVDWQTNQHVDLVADLGQRLCFDDATFDTVILSDVLEHLPDPMLAVGEIHRVLKAGGVVITNTPFLYWLHEEPYDFQRLTEFGLRRLLNAHRFEVESVETLGGALEVVVDVLSKLVAYSRALRLASYSLQVLALTLSRSRLGTKVRRRTATKFPLAYGVVALKPILDPGDARDAVPSTG